MLIFLLLMSPLLSNPPQIRADEVGLSLTFSESWVVKPEAPEPLIGLAELPPRRALAMMMRHKLPPSREPKEVVEEFLTSLNSQFDSHEVLKQEDFKLAGGRDGHFFVIKGKKGEIELQSMTYMFRAIGQLYILTFSTNADAFKELEADFKSTADSLVFAGPPGFEKTLEMFSFMEKDEPDYAAMAALIEKGANVNGLNEKAVHPLVLAAFKQDAKLVKWLLERGSDPDEAGKNIGLFNAVGTPTIRELLRLHQAAKLGKEGEPRGDGKPVGLEIHWPSPEHQLFSGINNMQIDDVREAIGKGADMKALDKRYQLPALPLVRRLIAEFKEVGLDPSPFKPIEDLLMETVKN